MRRGKSLVVFTLVSTLVTSSFNPIISKALSIGGTPSDGYTNKDVTVSASGASKLAVGRNGALETVNGTSYTIKDTETEDCDGHWFVKAYDDNGNCDSVDFVVDKHAPLFNSLSEYDNEKKSTVTKTIKVKNFSSYNLLFRDENLESVKVEGDKYFKERYGSNIVEVDNEGFGWTVVGKQEKNRDGGIAYKGLSNTTVTCTAKDLAGNSTVIKLQFAERVGPSIKVNGTELKDDAAFNRGIKFTVSGTNTITTIDGMDFNPKAKKYNPFMKEGKHTINAIGEFGANTKKFCIDTTKPTASVKQGKRYKSGRLTLSRYSYSDNLSGVDVKKTQLTCNGSNIGGIKSNVKDNGKSSVVFSSYKLTNVGSYVLTVYDKAGNTKTYKFKVVK